MFDALNAVKTAVPKIGDMTKDKSVLYGFDIVYDTAGSGTVDVSLVFANINGVAVEGDTLSGGGVKMQMYNNAETRLTLSNVPLPEWFQSMFLQN